MAGGKVVGLEDVMRNLNAEISKIETRSADGLLAAGLIVEAESKRRTPVDTGNLRASSYTRKVAARRPTVEIGYTAAYAVFVHEAEGKLAGQPRRGGTGKGRYWETGEPRFLANALDATQDKILETIADHADVDNV